MFHLENLIYDGSMSAAMYRARFQHVPALSNLSERYDDMEWAIIAP